MARSRSRAISPSASMASARRNPRPHGPQFGPAARQRDPPALERRHAPPPVPGLAVLDHHVAQPRADAPADPPGIVIAVLDLALDAALVIIAHVRKPGQDNGVARRGLDEQSMPPNPVSIRTSVRPQRWLLSRRCSSRSPEPDVRTRSTR